jgi:hypothetical protein
MEKCEIPTKYKNILMAMGWSGGKWDRGGNGYRRGTGKGGREGEGEGDRVRTREEGKGQCCGSGKFIPDPGSRILIFTHPGSRIPDPKTGRKERGEKNFFVKHFFVATNFAKCKII